ncbi:hypothetical protein BOTBODRAFT_172398 [Botryobasidium botryosum FD-172 SS1]|uniref:Uncharacterized protein n=1 Tax=Botryobasidium botryosum (strain FD-172 SS1) TaxID=930990 RepID=A0A067MRQ0_BOTB1|nr:hypothetical protein BOTBODRAFT_172398 [Botryobasidium botryosum FD-172 SS1]
MPGNVQRRPSALFVPSSPPAVIVVSSLILQLDQPRRCSRLPTSVATLASPCTTAFVPPSPSSSPQSPSHVPAALNHTRALGLTLSLPYTHAHCAHSLRASRTPHVGCHWKNATNQHAGPSRTHTSSNHRTTIKQQPSPFARVQITHELRHCAKGESERPRPFLPATTLGHPWHGLVTTGSLPFPSLFVASLVSASPHRVLIATLGPRRHPRTPTATFVSPPHSLRSHHPSRDSTIPSLPHDLLIPTASVSPAVPTVPLPSHVTPSSSRPHESAEPNDGINTGDHRASGMVLVNHKHTAISRNLAWTRFKRARA